MAAVAGGAAVGGFCATAFARLARPAFAFAAVAGPDLEEDEVAAGGFDATGGGGGMAWPWRCKSERKEKNERRDGKRENGEEKESEMTKKRKETRGQKVAIMLLAETLPPLRQMRPLRERQREERDRHKASAIAITGRFPSGTSRKGRDEVRREKVGWRK